MTIYTEAPTKHRNYKQAPGHSTDRIHPTPLLPAITGGPPPRIPGRKEPSRHEALKVAAVDTRPGRDEAVACTTSAGDTPRAPTTMDTSSPPTTDAAGRYANQFHSPNFHTTRNCFFILEPKGQKTPLPTRSMRRRQTPKQSLHIGRPPPHSPIAVPGAEEGEVDRDEEYLIPYRQRHLHQAAVTGKQSVERT